MEKPALIECFSRAAESYDAYATIQSEVGRQLLTLLDGTNRAAILELGCGTGNFTNLLTERFAEAEIQAVDISPSMIEVAARKIRDRAVTLRVADAETMELAGPHDLVTSNASFQWFQNLPALLPRLARACAPHGTLLFSSFGPDTYCELNVCLRQLWGPDAQCVAEGFPARSVLEDLLRVSFPHVRVRERPHVRAFNSLWDLLRTIKYTGTQGVRSRGRRVTRADVRALEQDYVRRFGGIVATYQVFYGQAQSAAHSRDMTTAT